MRGREPVFWGVLIGSAPTLYLEQPVQLVIRLPDGSPITLSTKVVRVCAPPGEYGLEFDDQPGAEQRVDSESATLWLLAEMSHNVENALVIHRSCETCRALVRDLRELRISAVAVTTAADALAWIRASGGCTKLVLLDSELAEKTDDGAPRRLHEDAFALRQVLVTDANAENDDAPGVPFDSVLFKPWTLDLLSQSVRP